MNDDLIYKLTWMLNDEKSSYKQQILEQAIDALKEDQHETEEQG